MSRLNSAFNSLADQGHFDAKKNAPEGTHETAEPQEQQPSQTDTALEPPSETIVIEDDATDANPFTSEADPNEIVVHIDDEDSSNQIVIEDEPATPNAQPAASSRAPGVLESADVVIEDTFVSSAPDRTDLDEQLLEDANASVEYLRSKLGLAGDFDVAVDAMAAPHEELLAEQSEAPLSTDSALADSTQSDGTPVDQGQVEVPNTIKPRRVSTRKSESSDVGTSAATSVAEENDVAELFEQVLGIQNEVEAAEVEIDEVETAEVEIEATEGDALNAPVEILAQASAGTGQNNLANRSPVVSGNEVAVGHATEQTTNAPNVATGFGHGTSQSNVIPVAAATVGSDAQSEREESEREGSEGAESELPSTTRPTHVVSTDVKPSFEVGSGSGMQIEVDFEVNDATSDGDSDVGGLNIDMEPTESRDQSSVGLNTSAPTGEAIAQSESTVKSHQPNQGQENDLSGQDSMQGGGYNPVIEPWATIPSDTGAGTPTSQPSAGLGHAPTPSGMDEVARAVLASVAAGGANAATSQVNESVTGTISDTFRKIGEKAGAPTSPNEQYSPASDAVEAAALGVGGGQDDLSPNGVEPVNVEPVSIEPANSPQANMAPTNSGAIDPGPNDPGPNNSGPTNPAPSTSVVPSAEQDVVIESGHEAELSEDVASLLGVQPNGIEPALMAATTEGSADGDRSSRREKPKTISEQIASQNGEEETEEEEGVAIPPSHYEIKLASRFVNTEFGEQVQGLAGQVIEPEDPDKCQVLMLVGMEPNRQRADIAAGLGLFVSPQRERPTLLIDADPESRVITRGFEKRGSGLLEVVGGKSSWQQCTSPTSINGLHTMPCGLMLDALDPTRGNQGDLIRQAAEQWREKYGLVIVDAGIAASSLSRMLSRHADAAYICVQLGKSPRELLVDTTEFLIRAGAQVKGCITTNPT